MSKIETAIDRLLKQHRKYYREWYAAFVRSQQKAIAKRKPNV